MNDGIRVDTLYRDCRGSVLRLIEGHVGRSIKVLVLATKYFGVGGAEAYARMFTHAVGEAHCDTDVLSFLSGEAEAVGWAGRYLGHVGNRSCVWTRARFVIEALRRGRRYSLLICSHVALAPLGMILSRLFGIPYLVIGYGIDVWNDVGPVRRTALQHAARVVAISQFTARMLTEVQGVPPERVSVIYPAVDPTLLLLAQDQGPRRNSGAPVVLLTVARLCADEGYKGCDTVLHALSLVQQRIGAIRYVIVGDGDDRARLESIARDLGVSEIVRFVGRVRTHDLAAYYRACDAFVMPSTCDRRATGWTGEGFGIVYIEAASFGRPVIAGIGGGAPEAVLDGITGYLVNGHDVHAVADAITRISGSADVSRRMGSAGQQWVLSYFSFERFRRAAADAIASVAETTVRREL